MNNLHTRLMATLAIVLLSGLLIIGGIILQYGNNSLLNNRMADLELHAKSLSQVSLDSLWSEDSTWLEKNVALLFSSDNNYAYIAIVHPSGEILAHSDASLKNSKMTTLSYSKEGLHQRGTYQQRDVLEYLYPVFHENKLLANIHVAYYVDNISILNHHTAWQLFLAVFICFSVLGFVSYFIIRNFSRGVQQLTWSMGKVALEMANPVNPVLEKRKDEVGDLARACKKMLDDMFLKYSEMAIRLHNKKSIIDAFSEGIIVFDDTGMIESVNVAGEHIFGYAHNEIVGNNVMELMPATSRKKYEDYLDQYRRSNISNLNGARIAIEGLRKDGSKMPLEIVLGLIKHDDKTHFVSTVRDMTTRYEYEQALKMSKEAAEDGNRVKTEFIATMSHELRTPMNAVMGMIDLLEGESLSEDQQQYVQMAKTASKELLTLLDNILDFPGLDNNQDELDIVEINIREMLISLINAHEPFIKDKDLLLKYDIEANVASHYKGDATRIRKIISHLLNNAIKFTPSGEIVLNISITEHDQDKTNVRFEVSDSGIGIATRDYTRIFDLFTQVDSSSTRIYDGIGIGLAICKRKVENLGGQIGVISEPGKGSTFWFQVDLLNVDTTSDIQEPDTVA